MGSNRHMKILLQSLRELCHNESLSSFRKRCRLILAGCLLMSVLSGTVVTAQEDEYIEYYDESDTETAGQEQETPVTDYSDPAETDEEIFWSDDPYTEENVDTDIVIGADDNIHQENTQDINPQEDPAAADDTLVFDPDAIEAASAGVTTNQIPGWPHGPAIDAQAALVLDDETGMVLYAKNMDAQLDPGSTVKIMTALLALENGSLTDEVTMTATGVGGVTDGGFNISARLGETFTLEECVYALILASANDVALQLAEQTGGSVAGFVRMMNEKAAALGCTDTVFVNPTGMEDAQQHTTAHDLALIMQSAMKNEDFVRIASARTYTIPATNMSGGERFLNSTFSMLDAASPYYYEGTLGGKQGTSQAAGSTLLTAAQADNVKLICAVLGSMSDGGYVDAASLLDYGFYNFSRVSLGEDDFDILSGGDLLVPVGTDVNTLQIEEKEENGEKIRTYLFGGIPVGTAVIDPMEAADEAALAKGQANLEEARKYSEDKSDVPYYIIAGIGGLLALVLIILMIRTILKRSSSV